MRTTPQPAPVGVPVSLTAAAGGGLTIGRSSSPAGARAPPTAYQANSLGQRVLTAADHVRYQLPIHAGAASSFAGIRGDPAAYLRQNVR